MNLCKNKQYRIYLTVVSCWTSVICSYLNLVLQVLSVHSPLGVDPGLSVPNCQAFTQVPCILLLYLVQFIMPHKEKNFSVFLFFLLILICFPTSLILNNCEFLG